MLPVTLKIISAALEADPETGGDPEKVQALLGRLRAGNKAAPTRYYTEGQVAAKFGVSKVFLMDCRNGKAQFGDCQTFPFRTLWSPARRVLYIADEVDGWFASRAETARA